MFHRSIWQKCKDCFTLPVRAIFLFEGRKFGLTSIRDERFVYAASEVRGYCLDIGCGKYNRFINVFLDGNGKGIDVFQYDGLIAENVVADMRHFPFADATFDTVTFIANLNHIPVADRDTELAEAYRCLKSNGNIIVTMPCAAAGVLIHKFVHAYDHFFGTNYDVDSVRGMHHDEEYYLGDQEIIGRLRRAGFIDIKKRYFWTQWGMNHSFVARK